MKVFVGGVAAAILGFFCAIIWYDAVFKFIGGAIPLILLLGGLMAAYLGYDEVKEKLPFKKSGEGQEPTNDAKLREEAEKYKQEVERLKGELEKNKTS
jgi:predicted DNA repair protein MutK